MPGKYARQKIPFKWLHEDNFTLTAKIELPDPLCRQSPVPGRDLTVFGVENHRTLWPELFNRGSRSPPPICVAALPLRPDPLPPQDQGPTESVGRIWSQK